MNSDGGSASGGELSGVSERAPPRDQVDIPRVDHYRIPKMPPFIRNDPGLWFLQVERTLRLARIVTDETKADTVVAALDSDAIVIIRDILLIEPPPANQYGLTKERFINAFATSAESKLRRLLKGQVLDDGKASLLLSRLRNLSDGQCNDSVIKSIFLEHLPSHHRAILVSTGLNDLNRLAQTADEIADTYSISESQVSAVSSRRTTSPGPSNLEAKVDALAQKLEQLDARLSRPGHYRSQSRPRSSARFDRSRRRSKSPAASSLCFIHRKYGHAARNCVKPCSWKSGSPSEN